MGIRRRRRKLTTLMSRMEQRVRAVELRPISLLTSAEVAAAVEIGAPAVGPETVVSASAPYQFKKVQDGYVYPKALTGLSNDRVELYTEADTGAAVGDRVEVSGIHWASSSQMDVTSDNFTVTNIDEPAWSGRPSYKHDPTQDQLAGVTISHAYEFVPESSAPQTWTSRRRLQTRRKVDSFEISAAPNSIVTLTMNATHHFEVGDVIFVDIFSESSQAYGTDGLFYVSNVSSNTIEYELTAGVDTAVSSTDVSSADVYVFPVIREWAQDGSIWVDSANNETYYWDGLRWVEYTPGAVAGDGDPPSPPTSFSATSEINYPTGSVARVQVSLSWTAPTTSESGDPITDLASYLIKWRAGSSGDWKTYNLEDSTATSFTFGEVGTFARGTTYNFELYAKDSGGETSSAATASTTTPTTPATNITTVRPAALTNDPPYLGTVTLYWDGTVEDSGGTGQTNPPGLYYLEIHRSTSATFTASASTLIGTVVAIAGAKYVDGSLSSAYGSTFYYRAVLVDGNGTSSLQSDPPLSVTASSNVDVAAIQGIIDAANITPGTIVTGQDIIGLNVTGNLIRGNVINAGIIEANSITSDQIDVGNLTAQIISSGEFTTRATPTSSGITIDSLGITAFNGTTPTFFVNSANGYVSIASGMSIGDVTAAYNQANSAYNTANTAQSTATTASSTANTANSTANGAATDVATLEGNVYYPGTTEIDGGNIRTGTVTATQISASYVYAGSISASQISAGTLTGFRIQTSSSGKRILISESSNSIVMYNDNGTIVGRIQAGVAGTVLDIKGYNGTAGLEIGSASTVVDGNLSTSGTANIYAAGRCGQQTFSSVTGTTTAVYRNVSTGLFQPTSSDSRLKENVVEIGNALATLNQLRPVTFNFISEPGGPTNYGLIAQEVQSIYNSNDNIVNEMGPSDDGVNYLSIEYTQFIPQLIKAIQELSTQVDSLEARIATLEGN